MKYYCEKCGSVFDPGEKRNDIKWVDDEYPVCAFCLLKFGKRFVMQPLPAHETVAQWELRKNEKYPYTAPVYYYNEVLREWECIPYDYITYEDDNSLIVATETGAPPNDWRAV
jgi:NAD-dependent SIR2 family protein deacetylase